MNNILIPTDFSEESLKILGDYLISSNDNEVNVLFFHAIKLSDSITDLLLLSRRTKETEMIPNAFKNYCICVQQEFSKVNMVKFQYFYGHTMAIFRNFLEANEIDLIVYDPTISLAKLSKSSIDPYEIIHKSKCRKWQGPATIKGINAAPVKSVSSAEAVYQ